MSDRRRVEPHTRYAPAARYGAEFWDAVECEIEALDASDFVDFLAADELPFEPRAGFSRALGESLAGLCRTRFSN
jgi:hypothetical protein